MIMGQVGVTKMFEPFGRPMSNSMGLKRIRMVSILRPTMCRDQMLTSLGLPDGFGLEPDFDTLAHVDASR
jgi:hypothetical protein